MSEDQKLDLKLDSLKNDLKNELKSQFDSLKDELLESLGGSNQNKNSGSASSSTSSILAQNSQITGEREYVLFSVFRNAFNHLDNEIKTKTLNLLDEINKLKEEVRSHHPL